MWTLCEPTTLQSFSRYRVDMKGQEMGSPVSGVFQMWNNSKSPIRYLWGKISDCHIIEVEPGTGVIGTLGTAGGVVTCWLRKKSSELKGLVQGSWCPVTALAEAWDVREMRSPCKPDVWAQP